MHYQTVVKGSDIKQVTFWTANNSSTGVAILKEFNEKVHYQRINEHTIRITEEHFDGEINSYTSNRHYNFQVLPFLVAAICYEYGIRFVEVGLSKHSVVIYDTETTDRFIPTTEAGRVYLHDREGVLFIQNDQYFTAVADQQVAELLISNMDYSLRFFDQKYLIRFKVGQRYLYFPLADVFLDSGVREMKHRNIQGIANLPWKNKLKEILAMPDQFTKPRK